MKRTFLLKTMLLLCALVAGSSSVWGEDVTYSMTPDATTTGSSATSYITTLTEFTHNNIKWKMNQWNPSTLQIKTNQTSAASEFRFYNTSSFPGRIKQVVITFSALTVSDASKLMFKGGSSEVSGTSGGTAGTWNSTAKTLTWTPASTDNFTYFAFYQDGKAASGTNNLASSNAIVVTYETSSDPAINAENVEIAYNATSGEIPFTISNAVENTHLTASITAGDEWLSDADVDETNGKVTFSLTENTTAKREGTIRLIYGNNLVTKDIKVTQAGLYSVTYTTTQTGGTLVVKNGDDIVASDTKFPVGTVLSIVATPDDNYAFKNWQYKKGTGSWVSNTTATTYTIDDNNVEFRANFDATYPVNFYVNGQVASTARFAEGKAITFPENPDAPTGYRFIGWAEAEMSGTSTVAPTIVTEATMGTAEKNYYAVFGKIKTIRTIFDASNISNLTKTDNELEWTDNDNSFVLYLSAGQHYTSGTPNTFTVTKGTSNYFKITVPDGFVLSKIVTVVSGTNYKINSVTAGTLSTSGTTQTITFDGNYYSVNCKATSNNQIRATTIAVDAITITSYCTTVVLDPSDPVVEGETVTLTTTENMDGWRTFYDAAQGYTADDNTTVYVASDNTATKVTLVEIGSNQIPANTPVILKTTDANRQITLTQGDVPAFNGINALQASTAGQNLGTVYRLGYGSDGISFYKYTTTSAPAGVVYVPNVGGGNAPSLSIEFGSGATSIEKIANSEEPTANGQYYNLNGQRVAQPTKGLYIVNGRKVIMK